MLTRKLNQASRETNKLVDWLVKREYYTSPELVAILERANTEIVKITDGAIEDVIRTLQASYIPEAMTWARNEQTKFGTSEIINISKAEQAKAATEARKMKATVSKLYEVL